MMNATTELRRRIRAADRSDGVRSKSLFIRVTPAMHEQIKKTATQQGVAMSVWFDDVLTSALARKEL